MKKPEVHLEIKLNGSINRRSFINIRFYEKPEVRMEIKLNGSINRKPLFTQHGPIM
jgi:hypothetical protein